MALMFGAFEFSWFFYKQQLVVSGVRDAARYLARTTADNDGDPCSKTIYVDNAKSIAVSGQTTGGTSRVPGWTTTNVTITCPTVNNSSGTYLGGTTIYRVTVSTSFTDPALGYFGMLGLSTPNLSASHSERSIGPG
jgi:Flp pilus assembly protein TadG